MSTFYSTLIQTVATLLGIFLAALATYVVFLQTQKAALEDQIISNRVQIQQHIVAIQNNWPTTPPFTVLGFIDRYSNANGHVQGLPLVLSLIQGLRINRLSPQIEFAAALPQSELKGENLYGRVYYSTLNECVKMISGDQRLVSNIQILGSPGDPIGYGSVFPADVSGPGYERWRSEFRMIVNYLDFLRPMRSYSSNDFSEYRKRTAPEMISYDKYYDASIDSLFKNASLIEAEVSSIDRLQRRESRYDWPQRLHVLSLLLISALCVAVGVVVPLYLLSVDANISKIAAVVISSVVLISLAGIAVQFAYDVAKGDKQGAKVYLEGRWLSALKKQVEQVASLTNRGSTIDSKVAYAVLSQPELSSAPDQLRKAISDFAGAVTAYNQACMSADSLAEETMERSTSLKPFIRPYSAAQGGYGFTPNSILRPDSLEQVEDAINRTSTHQLLVETATWESNTGRFLITVPPQKRAELIRNLLSVASSLNGDSTTASYRENVQWVRLASDALRLELAKFSPERP
jgi:hypothetical protein